MSWFTGIIVYFLLWWLFFMMSLPIGARSYHEAGERVETGNVESAPLKPRIWTKVGGATVVAALAWLVVYFVIDSGLISFRPGA